MIRLFPPSFDHLRHRLTTAGAILVLGITLTACAADVYTRGNLPPNASLESIKVGESSRAQVASALGTPSTTSLFGSDETWFYIGARTQQFAVWPTEELARQIVAVRFDQQGTVESVSLLDKEDGTQLAIVDRQTPTAGQELNIVQQLLGNLGRFNTEGK